MFYIGCLPIIGLILILFVVVYVLNIVRTARDVLIGLYLTIKEKTQALFKPTPLVSEIEDTDYYLQTELRDKLYDKDDGEYVSYKDL